MTLTNSKLRLTRLLLAAAILILVLPGLSVLATQTEEAPMIRLQFATFDPLAGEPPVPAELQVQAAPGAPAVYIVQFSGPVQAEWAEAVKAAGARLYSYLPDYAFLARMDAAAAAAVRSMPFVRWIGAYQTAYRMEGSLATGLEAQSVEPVELSVQALPDADLSALAAQVEALGGSVTAQSADEMSGYLRVKLEAGKAAALAALDGVVWVEPYLHSVLFNDVGGGIMYVSTARTSLGLYGSGQVVAVADTGLDVGANNATLSDDFEGRLVQGQAICAGLGYRSTWSDFHGHGTHVSGSVLSSGKLSGANPGAHQYSSSFAGSAPEAQLVFQSIDDPTEQYLECIPANLLAGLIQPAYNLNARIHSNSWRGPTGDNTNPYGGYNTQASNADHAAWMLKDMLILYAAGNSGTDFNGDGRVDPDSIGSPGTAKNPLTVGATENNRPSFNVTWGDGWGLDFPADPVASDPLANNSQGMAAFSSRGPTDDGRVKPAIVAPGAFILSNK